MSQDWIVAREALARLRVRPQTLYAYVSRGLVAARHDAEDPRRSLYAADDVARLVQRKARGRRMDAAARSALAAGEPVLDTRITTLAHGAVLYRGHDAAALAEHATLEEAARLLWDCGGADPFAAPLACEPTAQPGSPRTRMFARLAERAAGEPPTLGRADAELWRQGAALMGSLTDAACGRAGAGPMHARLARAWGCDAAGEDLIRRALVLCADHELNASTFAARVAASTGASLAAACLAGLSTLSGPLHGGMTASVGEALAQARASGDIAGWVTARLARGRGVPGFGHPLHGGGDPRARALAAAHPWADDHRRFAEEVRAQAGKAPNLDFALVADAQALRLPADAPFLLFALGRTAGWIAHALEQRQAGELIRPRARYVGPAAAALTPPARPASA